MFLYRAVGVPLVVFAEQRSSYHSVLAQADAGVYQPFVDFTFDAALDSMGLVTDTLRRAASPWLQERADQLAATSTSSTDAERAELRAASLRLLDQLERGLGELANSVALPAEFSVRVHRWTGAAGDRAHQPAASTWGCPQTPRAPCRSFCSPWNRHRALKLRLCDVQPSLRPATERRIAGWLEEEAGEALDELSRLVQRGRA